MEALFGIVLVAVAGFVIGKVFTEEKQLSKDIEIDLVKDFVRDLANEINRTDVIKPIIDNHYSIKNAIEIIKTKYGHTHYPFASKLLLYWHFDKTTADFMNDIETKDPEIWRRSLGV